MSNNKYKNFIPQNSNANKKKNVKKKPAFYITLCLMIFWTIGSIFGIIATAKSFSSSYMKTVSADTESALYYRMDYKSQPFFSFKFSGLGFGGSGFNSHLHISTSISLNESNVIYIISRNGEIPGQLYIRNSGSNSKLSFSVYSGDIDLPANYMLYYLVPNRDFYFNQVINYIPDSLLGTSYEFDCDLLITSGYGFNANIPVLYENGFLDSLISNSNVDFSNDLGFFQGGTFRCYAGDFSPTTNYSDWILLPEEFIKPYYSGVLFNCTGEDISYLCTGNYDTDPCNIVCDFGINGKKLGGFSYFMVVRELNGEFTSVGEFGSSVSFRFTDNSYVVFNTADEYFSYCDLTSYSNKYVRSVEWRVARSDIDFFGLTSSLSVIEQYSNGYNAGKTDGYSEGFYAGKVTGISIGKNSGQNNNFLSLMGAVVDAPIKALSGLLNFDVLGFNMLNFFYALCTCALIIAVVRMIL